MLNKNVNFIKEKEIKKEKEMIKMKEPYVPYNTKWLFKSKIGKIDLQTGTISYNPVTHKRVEAVVGYEIKPTLIKKFFDDPVYADFKIGEYNIKEAFEIISKGYQSNDEKKIKQAKRLYVKINKAIEEYNAEYTATLGQDIAFRLHRDAYHELGENYSIKCKQNRDWEALISTLPNKDPNQVRMELNNLSKECRQVYLMRAADYGVYAPTTEINRKDVYTMRIAPIAHEKDNIHPWNIYHETDNNDPIKTFVGRYKDEVILEQSENEAMAIAKWYAQYGDEFMEKCKPYYDVAYVYEHTVTEDLYEDDDCTIYTETVTRWVTETKVLFTGTKEECYVRLDAYREDYPTAVVLPSDKEITIREARRLGIGEYESYGEDGKLCVRDFMYDGGDIDE